MIKASGKLDAAHGKHLISRANYSARTFFYIS